MTKPDKLTNLLPQDHPWGKSILYYETLPSTNTLAKHMAAQGATEGTVIIAGEQTAGRGRLGRSFSSKAGLGLYLSLILRPGCKPEKLMHLTCAAGLAAADAVEKAAGFRPGIKWANDLVYGGQKLGGILTELGFDGQGNVAWAIVGIGVNCLHKKEDFSPELGSIAASLAMVAGREIPPLDLAKALTVQLEAMAKQLRDAGAIMARYREKCVTLGREICVVRGEEKRYGTAVTVEDDGALLVRYTDGTTQTVASGEVSIRGMYGYL